MMGVRPTFWATATTDKGGLIVGTTATGGVKVAALVSGHGVPEHLRARTFYGHTLVQAKRAFRAALADEGLVVA